MPLPAGSLGDSSNESQAPLLSNPAPGTHNHDYEERDSQRIAELAPFTKRYLFNVIALGSGFFGIFLAFNATQSLESTLNAKLGQWSISALYFSFTFSSMIAAPISRALGPKYSMVLGGLTYVGYMIANLYPGWTSLMISATLLGFGAAVLWTGEGVYLTASAESYSQCKDQSIDKSLGLFNGIFYFMMQLNSSAGNVAGAIVLQTTGGNTQFLFYIFIGIASLGVFLLLFLGSPYLPDKHKKIQNDSDSEDKPLSTLDTILETFQLLRDPRMYLLAPMILYSGMALGFVTGQYTGLGVKPSLGDKYWIGYVMAAFYISDTVFSISLGKASDRIGRQPVMMLGGVCQFVVLLVLIIHPVESEAYGLLFSLAVIFGVGDAAWQTQLSAFLGASFPRQTEAAFANFKLWQSAGMGMVFFYGPYLTLQMHSMVVAGVLVVSFSAYILLTKLPSANSESIVMSSMAV